MSHGRERPCSLAFCGHFALQVTKCHTTAMLFSVLVSFPHLVGIEHQNQSVRSESQ